MSMQKAAVFVLIFSAVFFTAGGFSRASEWPMWGCGEGRRNAVDTNLGESPELLWIRRLPEPERCWPFQYEDYYTGGNPQGTGKLSFDVSYEPVAGGGKLFVPSMVSDSVTAYDAGTGEELWRRYAGGPVRFAPVYNEGSVYFVSDDGYLYRVDADTGELEWRYSGSYSERKVLGNERIISMWPARGGPVMSGGIIYFASGVLPFEGIFVHAVCAESGESVWTNSTSGAIWDLHQHGGAYSYGGPAPQGYLAVSGERLIVPGGRTPPAVYDRETGEFLYFRQASGEIGKGAGGYRAHAYGDWFFNHGMLYSLDDGAQYGAVPGSVLTDESFIGVYNGRLVAHNPDIKRKEVEVEDRLSRRAIQAIYEAERLWRDSDRAVEELHFRAGEHLGVSLEGGRAALIRLSGEGEPKEVAWEREVEGDVWRMIASEGRLFVVTEGGKLYCFGESDTPALRRHEPGIRGSDISVDEERLADEIIGRTGKKQGYAIAVGAGGGLLAALSEKSELRTLALESVEGIEDLRRNLDGAGLYGNRAAVMEGTLLDSRLPPYFAELIVLAGREYSSKEIERAYESLRPYGGVLYVAGPGREIEEAELEGAVLEMGRDYSLAGREGPLPGAGSWTHQYAGPSNRTSTDEELVKPPLGVLWFGGPSNLNALPRHHNGPIPQVAGGRLFILGVDTLSARCVYTGRELWVKELPGIGHPFTSLEHEARFEAGREVYMPNHPGANFIGSPYVSVEDGVYVIRGKSLLHLDPATGRNLVDFRLPELERVKTREWGHLMVLEDYLIATADPQIFDDEAQPGKGENWNATSSSLLVVMDRYEGRVLWARSAQRAGYRHNAIAAGGGRLYAVDGLSEAITDKLRRRGVERALESVLYCFDIETGEEVWRETENIFGTWLGYYEDRDLLLEGGRHGQRGVLPDEPRRNLVARAGGTGETVWNYSGRYSGPVGLHRDMIIAGRPGQRNIDPDTGATVRKKHPVTGGDYDWTYHRYYGCGTMNSSLYFIMFRSGAAGITDLLNFGGTANLGGFRAGCTNNLVAADGVLNAPEYTRTCTCSYQLQTSLGFVHAPDVEMWTFNRLPEIEGKVERIGINFGAPGNRREGGVLWLEYPKVYERGPEAPVEIEWGSKELFRNHASWIKNGDDGHAWVGSYGAEGIEKIRIYLGGAGRYDVRLHFAEPGETASGQRVFDIAVGGRNLVEGLDIVKETGGPRRIFTVEFEGLAVEDVLEVAFVAVGDSLPAVVSGIEVVASE